MSQMKRLKIPLVLAGIFILGAGSLSVIQLFFFLSSNGSPLVLFSNAKLSLLANLSLSLSLCFVLGVEFYLLKRIFNSNLPGKTNRNEGNDAVTTSTKRFDDLLTTSIKNIGDLLVQQNKKQQEMQNEQQANLINELSKQFMVLIENVSKNSQPPPESKPNESTPVVKSEAQLEKTVAHEKADFAETLKELWLNHGVHHDKMIDEISKQWPESIISDAVETTRDKNWILIVQLPKSSYKFVLPQKFARWNSEQHDQWFKWEGERRGSIKDILEMAKIAQNNEQEIVKGKVRLE